MALKYTLEIDTNDHNALMELVDTTMRARGLEALKPVMLFLGKVERAQKAAKLANDGVVATAIDDK